MESSPLFSQKEKSLYKCWLNQSFSQEGLRTLEGKNISIISAGDRNDLEGPDFNNTQILIDGTFIRGDVEIHLDGRDWFNHRHHEDPVYNDVILHVVVKGDLSSQALTQNGNRVPTLILPLSAEVDGDEPSPCEKWERVKWEKVEKVFEEYARIRFQRKCLTIQSDLMRTEPEQYFYQGLAEVLGYSRNRDAFKKFTSCLSISKVYNILSKTNKRNRLVILEGLYFGVAGFLNSKRYYSFMPESEYSDGLKQQWCALEKGFGIRECDDLKWHFARTRPANHPTRRLAALSQIIYKMYPEFPSQLWIMQIGSKKSFSEILQWARGCFQQPGGLWRNHPLFTFKPGKYLIGDSRLMDLFSNFLLPFSWAIGSIQKNSEVITRSKEFSKKVAVGEIPASIQRLLSHLSISADKFETNYVVQGAIEFSRRFCDLELCKLCPLEVYAFQ